MDIGTAAIRMTLLGYAVESGADPESIIDFAREMEEFVFEDDCPYCGGQCEGHEASIGDGYVKFQ